MSFRSDGRVAAKELRTFGARSWEFLCFDCGAGRAQFHPASFVLQNCPVGKASKTFFFQQVRLMDPMIVGMLERDRVRSK